MGEVAVIGGRILFARGYRRNDGGEYRYPKIDGVTSSGEIHTDSLSGVKRLEATSEVIETGLSVSGGSGFFREIKSTLRIVVVLCARADYICV